MAKKKLKLPLAYQPVGFLLGWAGGALAGLAFRATWKAIRHEDEAPEPLDENRRWGRSCSPRPYRAPSSPSCAAPSTGRAPPPSNARSASGPPRSGTTTTDP